MPSVALKRLFIALSTKQITCIVILNVHNVLIENNVHASVRLSLS